MAFRLQGKSFLVTWSQVTHNWEHDNHDIFTTLQRTLNEPKTPARGLIALELHADGGDHVHAYIEFPNKIDIRLTDQWNYNERRPNVKAKRTRRERYAAYDYCLKDGIYFHFGDWIPFTTERESGDGQVRQEPIDLSQTAKDSPSYAAFLQRCFEEAVPFGYCSAAWQTSRQPNITIDDTSDEAGQISNDQLRFMHFDEGTNRALVIIGPTGCGKTVWARRNAPRPALFVRHVDDLKQFRENFHKSIVFDDMNFRGDENGKGAWPRTSQIHLVDFNCSSSIHTRYSVAFIPARVHKIFTGNHYMFTDDDAIERRVYKVEL